MSFSNDSVLLVAVFMALMIVLTVVRTFRMEKGIPEQDQTPNELRGIQQKKQKR